MLAATLAVSLAFQSSPPLYFEQTFDPTNLAFADLLRMPTDAVAFPGDDRIFVSVLGAEVRIIRGGELLTERFLDLTAEANAGGFLGLSAITLHPRFDVNGHMYLWYGNRPDPMSAPLDMVLARVTVDAQNPDRADPATLVELLRVPFDTATHSGGRIAFGPDGKLWIGIGDAGLQGDPECRAQDMTRLAGKMIRLDVDAGFPYVVPPDNPVVCVPCVAPEIVHSGLRNPWKWSFDDATGELWIGDVGGAEREEVNFVQAGEFGLNFGWPAQEGSACHPSGGCSPSVPGCGDPSFTGPAFEYLHGPSFGTECAVTGGQVYYGAAAPWLTGWYLCADLCTHRFWRIRRTAQGGFEVRDQPVVLDQPLPDGTWQPVSFGTDGYGELIVVNYREGMVHRLRASCSADRVCDGAPNVTGGAAGLRWLGSTSITANDATAYVDGLPSFGPALLFYGPLTDQVTLGNGTLCVGGALVRAWAQVADATGAIRFDLDLGAAPFSSAPGLVEPGSTWTLQAWYRDVGGPLGATYNFSGATRVTFCP